MKMLLCFFECLMRGQEPRECYKNNSHEAYETEPNESRRRE